MGQQEIRTAEYGEVLATLLREYGVRSVLDAATGTGVDSIFLLEADFTVTSVDLSQEMLNQARQVRMLKSATDERFKKWQIGQANWLDMENVEETVTHPVQGYDAIVCLGNSFAHLPDPTGDQTDHQRAISNFHKLLRPGGILVIDHRNYDYILEHGTVPNSVSKLYYQGGNRIHSMTVSHLEADWMTLQYEIDVSGDILDGTEEVKKKENGVEIPVVKFTLSYYPHPVQQFIKLLKGVFGETAEHVLLKDFRREVAEEGYVPSYFVHVIKKNDVSL